MRAMKDSGIPWIGQIPESWTIASIGSCMKEVNDPNVDTKETNALQFKLGDIISKSQGDSKYNPESIEAYNVLRTGDLVINGLNLSFDFISQRVGLVNENGAITSAYLSVRPTKALNSKFANYLLKGYDFCKALHGMGKGLRQTLSYKEFKKYLFFYPPLSEQERIADFLDTKCGEIDEMIALQEKTVEELKAYKQSVITEAVTKGLNPDAPMKDSGIPWIGLIPQGWKVGKAKNLCTFLNGYAYNSNDFLKEGKFPVIRIGDIQDGHISYDNIVYVNDSVGLDVYKTHIGDILIAMSGATTGKVGRVLEGEDGYINQRVGIIRSIEQEFVYYLFQTKVFEEYVKLSSIGSAQPNISSKGILNYTIVIPSHDEQQAIASYLDNKCSEIDSLIEIKQQKAEGLKTYKKSLIYEYVTGKKEVV